MTDLFKEKAENYDSEDWAKEIPVIGEKILAKSGMEKNIQLF